MVISRRNKINNFDIGQDDRNTLTTGQLWLDFKFYCARRGSNTGTSHKSDDEIFVTGGQGSSVAIGGSTLRDGHIATAYDNLQPVKSVF